MTKYKILFILLLCILFSGCSSPSEYQKSIYNDEKLITQEGDSYFSKEIDNSKENLIYLRDFTGSYTIWEKETEESTNIDINIEYKTKKGNCKIILIKDKEIYKVITTNEKTIDKKVNYSLSPGKYKIKIIGLYTSLDIKYEIN